MVVLAALLNALKIVDKKMSDIKVIVNGVGAAGVACTKIIMAAGVKNVVGCAQAGALTRDGSKHELGQRLVRTKYQSESGAGKR